jgi:hypothetical protein
MNDWYNDPPEHPEPPEWYALIEEAIGNDPPPAISTAIRKLIDDWTEEQNRMQGEPDVPDIYDHQALACGVCGSATWSLLRSGKIECAGCQRILTGMWELDSDKNPPPPTIDSNERAARLRYEAAAARYRKSGSATDIDAWQRALHDWQEATNRESENQRPPAPIATGVEARVCTDIAERQRIGIAKYGVTVERSQDDMLQHAYEEALDLSVYLKSEIERRQRPQ